jgi:hypothetical protein
MVDNIDLSSFWNVMYTQIKTIITTIGARPPGSANEKAAADYLTKFLQNRTSNPVNQESFTCYPRSFMGWPRVSACFALLGVCIFCISLLGVSMIITSIFAIGLMIFLFYAIWRQFFNYEEYIHRVLPVYEKVTSQNVVSIFTPTSTVKKRVVFAAHYDSVGDLNYNFSYSLSDGAD